MPMTTKYPPKLSLDEAVRVIKTMYETHRDREVSIDLMPDILRTKPGSSFFDDKISALQKFGFAEKRPNDQLLLTELAMKIIDPIGNEEAEAKMQAFRNIDVLLDLSQKYHRGKLPSAEQMQQILMKSYGIPRSTVKKWYQFIMDSFRAVWTGEPENLQPTETQRVTTENRKIGLQFTMETDSGESIAVSIPLSASRNDLAKVKAMIDAFMPQEK